MRYLTVEKLSFGYSEKSLISNVSFAADSGSLLRIAGQNGAGKSTLMLLLAGILEGHRGKIAWHTSDVSPLYAWLPAEGNGLLQNLSALENMKFWTSLYGISGIDYGVHLSEVGLTNIWVQSKLPVAKFSTGMKRRLALARLMAIRAPVWLLDEPLYGLDDQGCESFKIKLSQHCANGGAAIIITHDERLIEGMPAQTIFLNAELP
jgi:heme exporter protein A